MNNIIIKIRKMHRQSCASLIRMTLEDGTRVDFKSKIVRVSMVDEEQALGEVEFRDISDSELARARTLIEEIGTYEIVQEK